ncbi:MAG: pyridoxal-phosphate-dependent aminotransferase family protein [Treponema sp.]|uniref:pyridoxal-phosphate-dependent aminotransferase family protein n=1 Tax=Treponema sp. TaxID=166 RepID=UPI003FA21DD5
MNTLFTPGPILMDAETLAEGGKQAQYFRTPAFSEQMLECMSMLQQVLGASSDDPVIFLTASGTAAMEATVANLFTDKDKLLVIDGGTFGNRFAAICAIHNIPHTVIKLDRSEAFIPNMLDKYENAGYTGFLINVCETSTGQLYPMNIIADFCKRNNICLVADSISSFLCDPFDMNDLNCSAVIISSQKGLALSPGMSYVIVKKDVFDKRVKNTTFKSLYFNFNNYYPEILRGQTHYTPAITIINQLHEKLRRVLCKTVDNYIEHNRMIANYFRNSLHEKTKFQYPSYPLSSCVTPVYCPFDNAKEIVASLRDVYKVFVVPAAGEIASYSFRVAHMSPLISKEDIDSLINLLKQFQ